MDQTKTRSATPRVKASTRTTPLRTTDAAIAEGKRETFKQLAALLGLGTAVGGGTRLLMGASGALSPPNLAPARPATIPISLRARQEQEPSTHLPAWQKSATTSITPGSIMDRIAQRTMPAVHTANPLGGPIAPSMGLAAGSGGIYGGYKLVDWLLRKQRESQSQRSLQDAEQQYEDALTQQYKQAMVATDDAYGLNKIADAHVSGRLTKKAFFNFAPEFVHNLYRNIGYDNWENFKGGTYAAMLAAGTGTGLLAHNATKQQNKKQVLEKALKMRQQMRHRTTPATPYVSNITDVNEPTS